MSLALIILFVPIVLGIIYLVWRLRRRSRTPPQELYVCLDGHLVKSRGEWMVDAALLYLRIHHEYEQPLRVDSQVIHPDFSLGHDIFIEYWGSNTKHYLQYKRERQLLYKKKKYRIIELENEHLKNLLHYLSKKLEPFQDYFPNLNLYLGG